MRWPISVLGAFITTLAGDDPLSALVTTDSKAGKPPSEPVARFRRFGLALRPLPKDALNDKTQTLTSFLPKAVDAWRLMTERDRAPSPSPS